MVTAQQRRRAVAYVQQTAAVSQHRACRWLGLHRTPIRYQSRRFHYTPTYSSWLNHVELWFAKIERDMIARGIFTSTADLRRRLMQYVRAHNKTVPAHSVVLLEPEAPHHCYTKLSDVPLGAYVSSKVNDSRRDQYRSC